VDPTTFRAFAERPTAAAGALWQSVADGGIAVSYTMGSQDKLPVGGLVQVAGRTRESLRVGGFGTVGIGGVDAVVSTAVARSLGFPAGNAIVVSAPHTTMASLVAHIKSVMPKGVLVEPLVASTTASPGAAGAAPGPASATGAAPAGAGYPGLSTAQLTSMLQAAVSRLGMPYVWGAAGPTSFDCSGLVQWSFAQAGVVMPRVAADQARTGPAISVSQAQPGDLLFYHTDPTAPDYISHVAIYLGRGWMIQAPEPGETVQIVPLALGSEFAGVVRVSPRIAAAAAASPVG
jgi:cell wall-associated NlpC family hydrolase